MLELEDMRALLLELEGEMRAVGWWQSASPDAQALASTEPFCVDCLTFSEWLQWVYIPRMHAFMQHYGALPAASGLLPIAEEAWKGCETEIGRLLAIVAALDGLVQGERDGLARLLAEQTRH